MAEGEGGNPETVTEEFRHDRYILIHWRIWKERNARILDNVASTVDRVLELIKEDITMWRAAGCICDLPANA